MPFASGIIQNSPEIVREGYSSKYENGANSFDERAWEHQPCVYLEPSSWSTSLFKMNLIPPTFSDIQAAAKTIEGKVHRTPLRFYPALSELLDADVWVKHENFQLLGAFKVRGGINLISKASDEERARGYVSASSGNHGQSIAYAARLFGAKCTMVLPEGANPAKAASIKALGAELLVDTDSFMQRTSQI
jgi:threonine dehydratase